jgi:hypothetical protein
MEKDANTAPETSPEPTDVHTDSSPAFDFDDDGMASTVEYEIPDHTPETEEATSDGAEQETPVPESEGDEKIGFHDPRHPDHPRFQELMETNKTLKREIDELKKNVVPPAEDKGDKPKYQNLLAMEDDDLTDLMATNPKKFIQDFGVQLFHEFQAQQKQAQAQQYQRHQQTVQQKAYESELQSFFAEREDGQEMLKSGQIQQYLQDHPTHNPISAYYVLAEENMKSQTKEAIEAARKEERDRVMKELKAKGSARSFSSSNSGGTYSPDNAPEMKNPDKYGGRNNVLLKRLLNRQSA